MTHTPRTRPAPTYIYSPTGIPLSSFSLSLSIATPISVYKTIHFQFLFEFSNFALGNSTQFLGSYDMGSSFSLLAATEISASGPSPETGLGDLPESCVASVLVYLDPPQICRLAMLNRAFRGASSADFVWESKLPLNYGDVIDRVFEKDDSFCKGLCKRDIYSRLCRPNSFDGGTKVQSLYPFLFLIQTKFKKFPVFCVWALYLFDHMIMISHGLCFLFLQTFRIWKCWICFSWKDFREFLLENVWPLLSFFLAHWTAKEIKNSKKISPLFWCYVAFRKWVYEIYIIFNWSLVHLDYLQKVWLDKSTGKTCMSVSSNGLAITGIDDRRYWSRIPTEESRWGLRHNVAFVFCYLKEIGFQVC